MTPVPETAKTREVAPGIVEVFLPLPSKPTIVNVFLVSLGEGEWALVDTGVALDESQAALRAALAENQIEPAQLTHLLATHHHPDHFGASAAYRELTAGKIHLHPLELERVEYSLEAGPEDMVAHGRRHGMPIPPGYQSAPRPKEVWAGTFQPAAAVDHLVEDGEVIQLGRRRFEVVWTPGHTPGHCCYRDLESRTLFVGDHLLPRITPHVGVFATGPQNPLGDFLASMEKVAALSVDLVCPAHGGTYPDHARRARQLIRHHEYRLREMQDVIRAGAATAYDVARRVFRWVFEDDRNRMQIGAATMETIAHLQLLYDRGNASREDRDGVAYYRASPPSA